MYSEQDSRDIDSMNGLQQHKSYADVLIIDDSRDNLAVLDQLLTAQGYEVRVACDGAAGIRAARVQAPDLILLDVRLPYADGFAVCSEFKASDSLQDIPVIFISAVHDIVDKVKAFEVGGVDYITKPFRAEEVFSRVKTHLELAHLREQEKYLVLMKERQRLARDLHDSVKQTLFMIAATAESLQLQHDLPESKRAAGLDQLRQLSQAALSEMNMMLFELHPVKLAEVDLDKLLRQLADSLAGRLLGTITVTAESPPYLLPSNVKIAFFRVAQEALTNAVRHAQASQIEVKLVSVNNAIELHIEDNGVGFDPNALLARGFGLDNMRERAITLGLNFTLTSDPNHGTQISLVWSPDQRQS